MDRNRPSLRRRRLLLRVLLILALGTLLGFLGVYFLEYPLLSVTSPRRGELLVVDGWVPEYAVRQAAAEFKAGGYQQVLMVFGASAGDDQESARNRLAASVQTLQDEGIDTDRIGSVVVRLDGAHRTYQTALAAGNWLQTNQLGNFAVKSMDVATLGTHARRSRLLYRKAFGPRLDVGIIALECQPKDVRCCLGKESVAYLYTRLLFWPDRTEDGR